MARSPFTHPFVVGFLKIKAGEGFFFFQTWNIIFFFFFFTDL